MKGQMSGKIACTVDHIVIIPLRKKYTPIAREIHIATVFHLAIRFQWATFHSILAYDTNTSYSSVTQIVNKVVGGKKIINNDSVVMWI